MPPSSVKQLLKEARAALDGKDFDNAKKICRDVLKQDKSNYHAYIFIGVAAAGADESDRALQAYQKAIEIRPEQPLAYKGLIEILPNTSIPDKQLRLARAHISLATYASQFSKTSLPTAADILYSIAHNDPQLVEEALKILVRLKREIPPETNNERYSILSKTARLHTVRSSSANPEHPANEGETDKVPTSDEVIDEIRGLMYDNDVIIESDIRQMVINKVLSNSSAEENFKDDIVFLKGIEANEALLKLAETDRGTCISSNDRLIYAHRSIHTFPFQSNNLRGTQVAAAELLRTTNDIQLAAQVSGLSESAVMRKGELNLNYSPPTCTHALVMSLLYLLRSEYKICVHIARAGQLLAQTQANRDRILAILQLICASGLSGERKHKESMRELEKAKRYAQQKNDQWIELAVNHEIINTAVAGHGRRSRQASTAMEEAAGSTENTFGILECVWTEAIGGDVDIPRMEFVCENAVKKVHIDPSDKPSLNWESQLLAPTFTISDAEVAALALTRMGQMILAEDDTYPEDALKQAQKYQMDAANTFRVLANPFAQLGFIFEQQSRSDIRMAGRAMRCYEKAISIDNTHPLATRRLTRMLVDKEMLEAAAEIAQRVSEINPKARWAYNIVGWWRIENHALSEASVSFRNALRGRPRFSGKDEEILFGTTVGRTADDNDLLVDIDSWRGLSVTYQRQGKFSAALGCIDDALALLHKPPSVYTMSILADVLQQQKQLEVVLEAERAVLLFFMRRSKAGYEIMKSLLTKSSAPSTIKYHLSGVYQQLAADEWFRGCYRQATSLRLKSAQLLSEFADLDNFSDQEDVKIEMHQWVGDAWMKVITDHPVQLGRVISNRLIEEAFTKAISAYSILSDMQVEGGQKHNMYLAEAQLRQACFSLNKERAKDSLKKLLDCDVDPTRLAIAFMLVSQVLEDNSICRAAVSIAKKVAESSREHKNSVVVNATISTQVNFIGDVEMFSQSALNAIEEDPIDWRGWYAIALVREADAKRRNWPAEMLVSSEEAFQQADKLGGGPAAVEGRVRCISRLIEKRNSSSGQDDKELYYDACFCSALASKAGLDTPPLCSQIIEQTNIRLAQSVDSLTDEINSRGQQAILNHVHMFPFVPTVNTMAQSL